MYLSIVFLHGYEDQVVSRFLDGDLEESELFQHLVQWDYGDQELGASINAYEDLPVGAYDTVRKIAVGSDTYYLSYRFSGGYVGLTRKIA